MCRVVHFFTQCGWGYCGAGLVQSGPIRSGMRWALACRRGRFSLLLLAGGGESWVGAAAPVCMQERVGNSIRGYIEDVFCIICCTGVLWKCAAEQVIGDVRDPFLPYFE